MQDFRQSLAQQENGLIRELSSACSLLPVIVQLSFDYLHEMDRIAIFGFPGILSHMVVRLDISNELRAARLKYLEHHIIHSPESHWLFERDGFPITFIESTRLLKYVIKRTRNLVLFKFLWKHCESLHNSMFGVKIPGLLREVMVQVPQDERTDALRNYIWSHCTPQQRIRYEFIIPPRGTIESTKSEDGQRQSNFDLSIF